LKELDLPSGMLVGAVEHGDTSTEIAVGTTHIEAGDRAIVFVLPDCVEAVENLFAAKQSVPN
jgi:trk system potassium uptake protein TrkA